MKTMRNNGEQLLSEIVISLHELLPALDYGKVQNSLSNVLSNYKVEAQEEYILESDFLEKN